MWTRRQLKERAKSSFKRNYWKSVLVALVLSLFFAGGATGSVSSGFHNSQKMQKRQATTYERGRDFTRGYFDGFQLDDDNIGDTEITLVAIVVFVIVFIIIFLIGIALGLLINAFLINPIYLGKDRFFLCNLNQMAEVKEIAFGFDHCYKNVVKIMFFRDLYLVGWSLLFVIPGIIKSYEYRMIPFILAENPDMSKEQAFAMSRQMMMGQKWNTFVLDLSFILWHILGILTFGIVEIFYVAPYTEQTNAALYDVLRYGNGQPYAYAGGQNYPNQ